MFKSFRVVQFLKILSHILSFHYVLYLAMIFTAIHIPCTYICLDLFRLGCFEQQHTFHLDSVGLGLELIHFHSFISSNKRTQQYYVYIVCMVWSFIIYFTPQQRSHGPSLLCLGVYCLPLNVFKNRT